MSLKGARPGQFTPACPLCKQRFALTVPTEPNGTPIAKKIRADAVTDDIASALGIAPVKPKPPSMPQAVGADDSVAGQSYVGATIAPPARSKPSTESVAGTKVTAPRIPSPIAVTAPPAPSRVAVSAGSSVAEISATIPPVFPSHDSGSLGAHFSDAQPARAASAPPRPQVQQQASAPATEDLVGSLGGYELIRKLGAGGMGAVYLARQVSLDRNVAVKVLQPDLASDAQFVARFTREAFAAAQLNHHNVVQIHELGEQKDTHFFSMEFVEGQTLADVVRSHGTLDPEVAAGYILQAARGLKFAHDHGMVHRDIKPDNLMLNDAGMVKVADLGLVKTGGEKRVVSGAGGGETSPLDANMTQARYAMGTPAYMAPEQTQDAASVDGRADIYSLGCTFYDLLTGRPPFSGKTAFEVMTKHVTEAPVSPERISKHVPVTVSAIVMKMMAKKPEQRFQHMSEVVKALEDYLHVDSSKPFSPKQEHVRVLEFAVARFNDSKWGKLRPMMIIGFYIACLTGTVACGLLISDPIAKLRWGGAFVGLAVLTTLSYLIVTGITQRTFIFKKMRQLVFGASFFDWIIGLVGIGVICVALYAFDQHLSWIGVAVLAVMLANAFHFSIDLLMNKDRQPPILQTESMLKEMRLKGLEETAIRQFICKYGGEKWEAFYESMFGYEAKILARETWGKSERGKDRKKYAAWRDGLIAWIDHRIKSRKDAKARNLLQKLELKSLTTAGIDERAARKKAARTADMMVNKAEKVRKSARKSMMTVGPTIAKSTAGAVVIQKNWIDDDHEESDTTKDTRKRESYFQRRYGGFSGLLFGQQPRFLLAAIVLLGFCTWFYQNKDKLVLNDMRKLSADSVDPADIAAQKEIESVKIQVKDLSLVKESGQEMKVGRLGDDAAKVKAAPKPVRDVIQTGAGFFDRQRENISAIFGRWGAGLAGVVLLIGAMFRGKILGVMVILSAAIILIAPFVLQPAYFGISTYTITMIGGVVLAFLSIFWLRDTRAPG